MLSGIRRSLCNLSSLRFVNRRFERSEPGSSSQRVCRRAEPTSKKKGELEDKSRVGKQTRNRDKMIS
jgi:hypothetical protein